MCMHGHVMGVPALLLPLLHVVPGFGKRARPHAQPIWAVPCGPSAPAPSWSRLSFGGNGAWVCTRTVCGDSCSSLQPLSVYTHVLSLCTLEGSLCKVQPAIRKCVWVWRVMHGVNHCKHACTRVPSSLKKLTVITACPCRRAEHDLLPLHKPVERFGIIYALSSQHGRYKKETHLNQALA